MTRHVAGGMTLLVAAVLAGGALAQEAPKAGAEAPKAGTEAPGAAGEPKRLPSAKPAAPAPEAPRQPGATAEPTKPAQPGVAKPATAQPEQPAPGQKPAAAAPNGTKPAASAAGTPEQGKARAPRAGAPRAAAPKVTVEQRTQVVRSIRTVDVTPVRVDFRVNVGVAVPRTVVLAPLPAEVLTVVPDYEGYEFFETPTDIVIVDPDTLEIVAILPL